MIPRERLVHASRPDTTQDAASEDDEVSSLESAYREVRGAILSLRLPAGSTVSQVKLARQLGVSRTPLREAIRLLQREGLVTSEHNKRIRIAETSLEDMEQLYAARIGLEAVAIRISVPKLSSDELSEAAGLLDIMDNLRAPESFDAWEASHRRFHALLTHHAGPRTGRILSEMTDHAERYRRAFVAQGGEGWRISAEEHRAIFSACRARDERASSVLMARHLARTSLAIFLQQKPDHEPSMIRQALKVVLKQE